MKKLIVAATLCLMLLSLLPTGVNAHSCVDRDRDYWCDDCGMLIYHTCVDYDKDTFCDKCSCWIKHDCYDRNGDHECDQCGKLMNISVNITVTSYQGDQDYTTLYFYESTYPNIFKSFSGCNGTVTFSCAAKSYFKLTISKFGHPTRDIRYNTNLDNITLDVKLYPYGDVSQDGKVNVGDVARIYAHVRGTDEIWDDYSYECADVSGDGDITVGDTAKVYAHIRGTKPLW